MIIKLDDHKFEISGATATGQILHLSNRGAADLMESLARIRGFSIVDREERRSLMALTDEALDEHPDDAPASVWRTLAKTLASTVADALRFENDKEV